MTWLSSGLPPTSCSTFGRRDFNRVPLPAAMIDDSQLRCVECSGFGSLLAHCLFSWPAGLAAAAES